MMTKAYLFKCDINELVSILCCHLMPIPMHSDRDCVYWLFSAPLASFGTIESASQCDNDIRNLDSWSIHFNPFRINFVSTTHAVGANKMANSSYFQFSRHVLNCSLCVNISRKNHYHTATSPFFHSRLEFGKNGKSISKLWNRYW